MEKIVLSRQELYDLVWGESMLTLSRKYSISDVGLRKICKRMGIPVPKAGHWVKVKFGKIVRVPALPVDKSVANQVTLTLRAQDGSNPQLSTSLVAALLAEIRNDQSLPLTVPDRLTKPDELVVVTKEHLTSIRQQLKHSNWATFKDTRRLNLSVTSANEGRALRFFDTLIKLLKARGHTIEVQSYHTFAVINEQRIEIRVMEKMKMVRLEHDSHHVDLQPTGILTFRFEQFLKDEWISGVKPLESQLPFILAKLELEAKRAKAEHHRIAERRRLEDEKVRLKEEHKQRINKELSDFKGLIDQAKRLQLVTFLRQYLDIVAERAQAEGRTDDKFNQWMEWAQAKADWFDPLVNRKDKLLGLFNMDIE